MLKSPATWDCKRRIIVKAEYLEKGANTWVKDLMMLIDSILSYFKKLIIKFVKNIK